MTFTDYLSAVKQRNAKLFNARLIQIRPDALADLLRHAYEAGAGEERGRKIFDDLFPPLKKRGGMDRD